MLDVVALADQELAFYLSRRDGGYRLHLGDETFLVALEPGPDGTHVLSFAGERHDVLIALDGDRVYVHLGGETFSARHLDPVERSARHAGASPDDVIEAPMPGTVVAVHVEAGRRVVRGDTLIVIESMKLETAIRAARDGTVAALHVAVGQTFERSAPLVTLAPQEP
jgi:acetyl/propionyl-CoA carboxylase alpha subunit